MADHDGSTAGGAAPLPAGAGRPTAGSGGVGPDPDRRAPVFGESRAG